MIAVARRLGARRRRPRIVVGIVLAPSPSRSLSLRLLGMRRGWGTALLAGVARLGLGGRRRARRSASGTGAPTASSLHLVAIGIPATMTAAVALDLLARPGSLAIGERAGLVVAPRPVRAVRRRISVLRRYRELVRLARREGFGRSCDAAASSDHDSQAVRLRRVLEEAGGVYVKLGQIAATRVDLLPSDVCAELATLQNRVPPEPASGIAAVLEAELGDIDDDLRRVRVGAAGRGLDRADPPGRAAHRRGRRRQGPATGHRGDDGARPRRAGAARRPRPAAHAVRSRAALRRHARPVRRGPARRARLPTRGRRDDRDGRRGSTASRRSACRRCTATCAPAGCSCRSASRGARSSDVARARRAPASTGPALADQLLRSTLDQVMRLGFFHADPHPGNVFVLADGGARADRLRRRRPARSDPAVGDRRHLLGAGPPRRRAAARRRRARRRPRRGDVARRAGAGAGPDAGRPRAPGRRRSTRDVMQELVVVLARLRDAAADRHRAAVASARHARRHAARAPSRAAR